METRFYVYLEEKNVTEGPLAWDQLDEFDDETLVMTEERQEYWPLRRWCEDGSLKPTQHEHYKMWFYLLMIVPGVTFFLAPHLWRIEWVVAWLIMFAASMLGMGLNKKEFPRFPSSRL